MFLSPGERESSLGAIYYVRRDKTGRRRRRRRGKGEKKETETFCGGVDN